jgi:hypothetical protein
MSTSKKQKMTYKDVYGVIAEATKHKYNVRESMDPGLAQKYHQAMLTLSKLNVTREVKCSHMKEFCEWIQTRRQTCRETISRLNLQKSKFHIHTPQQQIVETTEKIDTHIEYRDIASNYLTEIQKLRNSIWAPIRNKKKRQRIEEKCAKANKRAKTDIVVEEDPTFLTVKVPNEKNIQEEHTINFEILSSIFVFLENDSNQKSQCMSLRLVCKPFLYAYHQVTSVWRMPDKLYLTSKGVGSEKHPRKETGYVDHWYRKLLLYRLYNIHSNDEESIKERNKLTKKMLDYKKLQVENAEPRSMLHGIFKRLIKMTNLLFVNVPEKLMNDNCELSICTRTQRSTIDRLIKLGETGLTILNTKNIKLHTTEMVHGFCFRWGDRSTECRHVSFYKNFKCTPIDLKNLFGKLAPNIEELTVTHTNRFDFDDAIVGIVFPLLKTLKVGHKMDPTKMSINFPALESNQ